MFEDPVVVASQIAEPSIKQILEITQAVKNVAGGSFKRSDKRDTSFFPKVTLLVVKDIINGTDLETLGENAQAVQTLSEYTALTNGWTLTEKGLLMLNLECPELIRLRSDIGATFSNFRPKTANQTDFGYKYFNQPLHLTLGTDITEVHMPKIERLANNMRVTLDPPIIYQASGNWNEDDALNIITRL